MAINKSNGATAEKPATTSGVAPAPVARTLGTSTPKQEFKGRDYDAEARGKVACASYAAALTSPGLAGLGFTTREEFLVHVRAAAEEMVKFTWEHQK